jgi:multimeric flavodoxin WrbA
VKTTARVLLVVGSPQKERSTSFSLGTFLAERMKEKGAEVDSVLIYDLFPDEARFEEAWGKMRATELVIFASPVYVDSLPFPVVRFMERAYARAGPGSMAGKHFLGLANLAFSEKVQGEAAIRIMHEFSLDMGFAWAGGLILPQGAMIDGRRLDDLGGTARRVKDALQLTAEAIMSGNDTPREAKEMLAKPMAPPWFYNLMSNRCFKKRAAKNGARSKLYDRPYP